MKKTILLSLALFALTPSTQVFAESSARVTIPAFSARSKTKCSDLQVENVVDWARGKDSENKLNTKIGEVRDQGDVGWCYAYAARDLIHQQKGIAPDLGYIVKNYYSTFTGSFFNFFKFKDKGEGGFVSTTVKASMKNGICPEYGTTNDYPTPENYKEVMCVEKKIKYSTKDQLVVRLASNIGRGHSLFREMDQSLARGKMVGISYNANGLFYEDYRKENFFTKSIANHASSIVGRFFNESTGTCDYIIRNSWGQDYKFFLKGFQKEGYHTITEEDLSQSLTEIVFFK